MYDIIGNPEIDYDQEYNRVIEFDQEVKNFRKED